MTNVTSLVDKYYEWLRDHTVWRTVGEWVEITTPYLDRHNDYIQIYLRQTADGYVLTDDGATIDDLLQNGCELETPKRKGLLDATLAGFGVKLEAGALLLTATHDTFALRKHNLVQAILAVNDLFYLASPLVTSFFLEDVGLWLDGIDARYTERVKFAGRSGFDHLFDFAIPRSHTQPERLLKVINHPNKNQAEAAVFAWLDTKDARPAGSRSFAFLNDEERQVTPNVVEALTAYQVTPVPWSRRDSVRGDLAA